MLFVVTGGGGYTGFHIGWKLQEGGHTVRLIDIKPPDSLWKTTAPLALFDALPKGFWGHAKNRKGLLFFLKINIFDEKELTKAFEGADGVIHTASFGVSGREQLAPHWDEQESVNVRGTQVVLESCFRAKVKCLVFTSTYNVVFGGQEIFGGDETMDLFPLHKHIDNYSRTKAIAEMIVLASNGKRLTENGVFKADCATFRACALRLNGIMGLGEKRHMDRVLNVLRSGLFRFTYGEKNARVDFVGIQNVVQAHIKALFQLLREQADDFQEPPNGDEAGRIVSVPTSGNAFFIADGSPVNNFEFFRPLVEGLGYSFPSWNLPFPLIMFLARLQEWVYGRIYKFYPFTPFVTPAEAYKTGRTHYFVSDRAFRAFGYVPSRPNDLSQVLQHYLPTMKRKNTFGLLFVASMMFLLVFLGWYYATQANERLNFINFSTYHENKYTAFTENL